MIKVLRHGPIVAITNPATRKETVTQRVTFIEEGRGGANSEMSETTDFLNMVVGVETGLKTVRVHTHSIDVKQIAKFPVGFEIPNGFINRKIYSSPQMRQQENVRPQMLNGKPAYFVTYIGNTALDDIDSRDSNETVALVNVNRLRDAIVAKAEVRPIEQPEPVQNQVAAPVEAVHVDLNA